MVFEKEYIGTVKSISMNDSMAAVLLTDGRLQVHPLDARAAGGQGFQKLFPEKDVVAKLGEEGSQILSAHITNEILVFAMACGVIHHYAIEEWALVNEFKHKKGLVSIFPQNGSTKLVFRDEVNDFFLTDPVRDGCFQIPNIS
ncbi:WD repeat-containing protein 19, partial [Dinochytrium kinnereticum]